MITPEKFNKIVNKLPKDKTELTKVELAIADDIKGIISQMKQKVTEMKQGEREADDFKKRIDKIFAEADKAEKRLEKVAAAGDQLYDRAVKIKQKAEKAAQDLGVDASNIGGYKELKNSMIDIDGVIADLVGKARTIY